MEAPVVTVHLLIPAGGGVEKTGNARTALVALGARVGGGVEKPSVVTRVALTVETTVSLTDKVTWVAPLFMTVLAMLHASS
jgi:hypothetical protein